MCCLLLLFSAAVLLQAEKQGISHVLRMSQRPGYSHCCTLSLSCFVSDNLSNEPEPLEFIQHLFLESLWKCSRQKNAVPPTTLVKIPMLTHNLPAIISTWKTYNTTMNATWIIPSTTFTFLVQPKKKKEKKKKNEARETRLFLRLYSL